MRDREIYFSQGSRSGVKYFLHRQSALSATLFIARAETAELTAVMSLGLMECFVPQCVRMPPGFCASCGGKLDVGAKMADSCPIFKCKESLSQWSRLSMAPNAVHSLIEAFIPLSCLCAKVLRGTSVRGCYLEPSGCAKVG